ncbi:hypothetical protein M758_2G101700 [Ceratodon purpureus]|nr:hypothetical protein M758_2G101700 [Ceratodon purpureus]
MTRKFYGSVRKRKLKLQLASMTCHSCRANREVVPSCDAQKNASRHWLASLTDRQSCDISPIRDFLGEEQAIHDQNLQHLQSPFFLSDHAFNIVNEACILHYSEV